MLWLPQRALDQLGDLLRDPFVHLPRQLEPVIHLVHVVQLDIDLPDQVVEIVEALATRPDPLGLLYVAPTQQPQDVPEDITNLLDKVTPERKLRRQVQEVRPYLRDLRGLARVLVPAGAAARSVVSRSERCC